MPVSVTKVLELRMKLPGVTSNSAGRSNIGSGEPWQLDHRGEYWNLIVSQENAKETADELAAAAKCIREAMGL